VGVLEGFPLGSLLGLAEEGVRVGLEDGTAVGSLLGEAVGLVVGLAVDGRLVG
jgi:hypothetical protein